MLTSINFTSPNVSSGFTLVELLIVISLIGIITTIVISAIDPGAQQNKARNSGLETTVNKLVTAASSYNAAYGNYPSCSTLLSELSGGLASNLNGCVDDSSGVMSISGITHPQECSGDNYSYSGSNKCGFYYLKDTSSFCISIAKFGSDNEYLKWESSNPKVLTSSTECQ